MTRFITSILLLLSLTGCNLFRKKTESTLFYASRDSSWNIINNTSLHSSYDVKSSAGTVSFETKGFEEVTVDKEGNIKAIGKNGVLKYFGTQKDSSASGAMDSVNSTASRGQVQDSTNLNKQLKVDAGVKVDKWLSWWFILGGVIIAILLILVFSNVGWSSVWKKFLSIFKD